MMSMEGLLNQVFHSNVVLEIVQAPTGSVANEILFFFANPSICTGFLWNFCSWIVIVFGEVLLAGKSL